MLIERMRKRLAIDRASLIEPCLPSPAKKPPSGANWIHEIKHDGFRLMARRDPVGIRLLTRNGNDWSARFPLVVEAVNHLKVRSCLIDGEVVCCDERGLAIFSTLRQRRNEARAFLFAFANVEKPHHPGNGGVVGADAFWTEPCGLLAVLTASHTAHALCEPDPPCMGSPLH
jgi:ATP-dependent DNA ligase